MKKFEIKKIAVALLSAVCLVSGGFCTTVPTVSAANDDIMLARYTALNNCTNNFSISSSGLATCSAATKVSSGYTAGITIFLQQYNGGWNTVTSWSGKDSAYITLTKTKYVSSGYKYRIMAVHSAYNSSGTLIETNVTYSSEVSY